MLLCSTDEMNDLIWCNHSWARGSRSTRHRNFTWCQKWFTRLACAKEGQVSAHLLRAMKKPLATFQGYTSSQMTSSLPQRILRNTTISWGSFWREHERKECASIKTKHSSKLILFNTWDTLCLHKAWNMTLTRCRLSPTCHQPTMSPRSNAY